MQILDKAHSTVLLYLSFSSFNDMMTMIGLSRHCGGYPDLKVEYPAQCEDKQFYQDIVSLLYLYDPRRLGEANMVYAKFAKDPDGYATWVKEEFGLTASVCHNLHVPNMVEEVEEVITPEHVIVASEIYMRPQYMECREIPREVSDVVYQFQQLMKPDIYGRLVQVCQFSYPSPQPLVRAIVDLYNEEWAKVFDKNPYAFLKATRESNVYRKESYINRSYKRPHVVLGKLNLLQPISE